MAATSKPSKSKASGATKKTSEKTSEKKKASSSEKGSKSKATTRSSGTSKSSSSRSGSSSATGASKTAGKSARAGSKSSTVKAAASSRKKETPKSGSAGKRTASGGAKKSTKTSSATSKSRPGAGSKPAASAKRSSATNSPTSKSSKAAKSTKEKGLVARVTEAVGSLLSGGERDVLDLLKEDHRRVDGHFQKVKSAEDANHEAVFRKIKGELDLHAHVEESIFYPHLMQAGTEKLKKIVREGVEEHAQVKTLLVELSELKGTDKVFKAKLKVLMENVEHHVKEEEDEMFPIVEDELSEETLVKLAEQIEKEKAKVARAKPRSRAASAMKS